MFAPHTFNVHPLGFYHSAEKASPECTVRLHVYPKSTEFSSPNEWHTHEFDLHSRVLFGSLGNEVGRFVTGDHGEVREFSVTYDAGLSALQKTGNTGEIQTDISFETSAPSEYFLRAGVLHRAVPLIAPCVTLVCALHKGRPILSYGNKEETFDRRSVTESEAKYIEEILSQVLDLERYIDRALRFPQQA